MVAQIRTFWQRVITFTSEDRFLVGASIFRIVVGLTFLFQYLINYHQRHYLYGPEAAWPYDRFLTDLAQSGSFSLYAISSSPFFFEIIFHLGLLFTTLWVIGWNTRIMTILTYVFLWSLHERAPVLWDGGDNLMRIIMIYAMFANLGAYFSLDADRLRADRLQGGPRPQLRSMLHNSALLAFAIQLCLLYGVSGLYKVQGEMWQNGTALYYIMRTDEFTWPGYSELIYQNAFLVTTFTYITVGFQIAFPFLFFMNRYTRWFALFIAFGFHAGIALFMGLITFSLFMISVEAALISDKEYRGINRWLRHLGDKPRQWIVHRRTRLRKAPLATSFRVRVFYDRWCPVCTSSITTLQKLDWLELLEPISLREPGIAQQFNLDVVHLEARMHAQSDRITVEGIDAVRLIATRIILLWPIVPVLWLTNRLGFGQRLYDWFAARRLIVAPSCDSQCHPRLSAK